MLFGHTSRITALSVGLIELESLVDKCQVIVSSSEDGQVNLWDLQDGHCIANTLLNIEGGLNCICFTMSRKLLICSGNSNKLIILDAVSLETVKSFDLCRNWISSMLVGFDKFGRESLIISTLDNSLFPYTFDEVSFEFTTTSVEETLIEQVTCPNFLISYSDFDRNCLIALNSKSCLIYHHDDNLFKLICKIDLNGNANWKHGLFVSEREVLLVSSDGNGYLYYLGLQTDLSLGNISELTTDSRAILTNGEWVKAGSKKFGIEQYSEYKNASLVATFSCPLEECEWICFKESKSAWNIYVFGQDQSIERIYKWQMSVGTCFDRLKLDKADNGFLNLQNDRVVVEPCCNWLLGDLWPLSSDKLPKITSALAFEQTVVLGYSSGEIRIVPESVPLSTSFSDIFSNNLGAALSGHSSAISCLYGTETEVTGKKLLVSACNHCTLRVWDTEDFDLIETFYHSSVIKCIVPFPSDPATKPRKRIACITADYSVLIVDLDDLTMKHRFSNQTSPIVNLFYRSSDELFAIETAEGAVGFWHFATGQLERVENSQRAQDILKQFSYCTCIQDYSPFSLNRSTRQTISVFPILSANESIPCAMIFLVNVKRLLTDIRRGSHSYTPVDSPKIERVRRGSDSPITSRSAQTAQSHGNNSFGGFSNLDKKLMSSPGKKIINMAAAIRVKSANAFKPRTVKPKLGANGTEQSGGQQAAEFIQNPLDQSLVSALFSCFISWGLDLALDKICATDCSLPNPGNHIILGTRGALGNISVQIPPFAPTFPWETSTTMSALRLLNIISTVQAVLAMNGNENLLNTFYNFYLQKLSDFCAKFKYPSFGVLAKHWQDPTESVREACKTIIQSTLHLMPEERRLVVLAFWKKHLPSNPQNKRHTKVHFRSAVVLGILASSIPEIFTQKEKQDIASSLETTLRNDSKGPYRVTACDLIGRSFSVWEPFINPQSVVKYLLQLTGFCDDIGSDLDVKTAAIDHVISSASKKSLISIAKVNTVFFVQTMAFEVANVKSMAERGGWLRVLGLLVVEEPLLMFCHLNTLMEAVVKALDPNIPHMRETLLAPLTGTLSDLVKTFPNVAFNTQSQKLIVGNQDGTCTLFDVKTATRIQILESHKKPVTAVSFSADGKLVATFSISENSLQIWQPAGGIFSAFAGAFGTNTAAGLPVLKVFRTFSVGQVEDADLEQIFKSVKLEWTSDRSVKVNSINDLFCVDCATSFFQKALVCPACDSVLSNQDDIVVTNLNPPDDYKSSVLAGLRPETVLEIANRALSFWVYQTSQETCYQQMLLRNCQERCNDLDRKLSNFVREATVEIQAFEEKLVECKKDLETERKKNYEISEQFQEKNRQLQKLQALYDKLKRKELLQPQKPAENRENTQFAEIISNLRQEPTRQPFKRMDSNAEILTITSPILDEPKHLFKLKFSHHNE